MTNMPAHLVVRNVRVQIGGKVVLNDVSVTAHQGEITAVVGANGAGKTSLLRAIEGTYRLIKGSIVVRGEDVSRLSTSERARRIAVLEQSPATLAPLSVAETVLLGRAPYRRWFRAATTNDQVAVQRAMETAGCAHLASRSLDSLSGGERQRVHLARAIAQDCGLLLLDEPLTYLDLATQHMMMSILRAQADNGRAVMLVMHDVQLALRVCDRMVLLRHGKILYQGPPNHLLPDSLLSEALGIPVKVWRGSSRADTWVSSDV